MSSRHQLNLFKLPHIVFEKEPWENARRKRSGSFPRKQPPTPSDRVKHADTILEGLDESLESAQRYSADLGIDLEKLQVIAFDSQNVDPEPLLARKFGGRIVQQWSAKDIKGNTDYRLIVHFQSAQGIASFRDSLLSYRNDPGLAATHKTLSNFFNGVKEFRKPTPVDRMGPRLVKSGTPRLSRFYVDVDL